MVQELKDSITSLVSQCIAVWQQGHALVLACKDRAKLGKVSGKMIISGGN